MEKKYFYAEMLIGEMFVETKCLSAKEVKQRLELFWGDKPSKFFPVPYPLKHVNILNLDQLN